MMRWIFIAMFLIVSPPVWSVSSSATQEQIQQIDAQLLELKEMKRGYESRAIRAEDQASRLQFEDDFVLETRRYYRIADDNREKAAKIQEEIDRLEAQKAQLIKKSQ